MHGNRYKTLVLLVFLTFLLTRLKTKQLSLQPSLKPVSQLTAEMTYDYEYLGRYTRLVITPITERVQFSLVAAITLRQTLAITGPSNSGKFETIKDYANVSLISIKWLWVVFRELSNHSVQNTSFLLTELE